MTPVNTGPRRIAALAAVSGAVLLGADASDKGLAPFESLYREAYERRLRDSGPDHPDTVASLVRLGALLRAHGNSAAAEPLLRKALDIQGPANPTGPDPMVELGEALAALGRNAEAAGFFRRSLERAEPGGPTARVLLRIATLREDAGDGDGARQAYLEALEHFEAGAPLPAEDRLARATAFNDLGLLLESRGELAEAEDAYRRSSQAHVDEYGDGHPASAAASANLASTLAARGRVDEAATLLERSLATIRAAYGPRHDASARLHNRLGEIFELLGRLGEAGTHYREALAIWRVPSASRGLALTDLGRLEGVLGNPGAARRALVEAISLLEGAGEAFPVELAEAYDCYGSVLRESGRLDEAEPFFSKALAIRERELGPSHPDVALSLVGLAGVLHLRGEIRQAGPLYQRALAVQEGALGPNHPDVGETLYNLGHLRHSLGDTAAAKDAFERSAEILSRAYGPQDPFVAEIRAALLALP